MKILEEFWYGNLEPAEYDASPSKEYKDMLQLISRNEDKFSACSSEQSAVSRQRIVCFIVSA